MYKNKPKTKLSTKLIMLGAKVACKVWWYARCKLRRKVNDFDYHISDLRSQYPNEVVYYSHVGKLPFYCKTEEVNDDKEKSSSIKIGDCNISYTFDKLSKSQEIDKENLFYLFEDTRISMLKDLITNTMVRHNKPKSLTVLNLREDRGESNVVKLHNK